MDNEFTEMDIVNLYGNIIESPVIAAITKCGSNMVSKGSECGSAGSYCCTIGTTCSGGKITSGACQTAK